MSICQTIPVATLFTTSTGSTELTSISTSVFSSAVPTTFVVSFCVPTMPGAGVQGCVPTYIPGTLTQEVTSTISIIVPFTITIATATSFTTICADSETGFVISTLPPSTSLSVYTSTSTSGDSVVIVTGTSTSVVTPTTMVPVSTSPAAQKSGSHLGAIIGGAVSGIAVVVVFVLLSWYLKRRRNRSPGRSVDDLDDDSVPSPDTKHESRGYEASLAGVGAGGTEYLPQQQPQERHQIITPVAREPSIFSATTGPETSDIATQQLSPESRPSSLPRPLSVADSNHTAPSPSGRSLAPGLRDVKDPMIYLTADRGLEVHGSALALEGSSPPLTEGGSITGAGTVDGVGNGSTTRSVPYDSEQQDGERIAVAAAGPVVTPLAPGPALNPAPEQVPVQEPAQGQEIERERERGGSQTALPLPDMPPPAYSES